jgi:hypothetical protein
LRLLAELKEQVDRFAAASGVTRAEAVRRLLTDGLVSVAKAQKVSKDGTAPKT